MANITNLKGTDKLREAYPVVNQNLANLNAENEQQDQRIDNLVGQSGSSNTEIVDARNSTFKNKTFTVLKDRLEDIESDTLNAGVGANQIPKRDANGNLQNIGYAVTNVSADTTLTLAQSGIINVTTGATNKTITLPDATTAQVVFTIKKADNGAGQVVINTTSSQTIDGATSKNLINQYATITVVSSNGNWLVDVHNDLDKIGVLTGLTTSDKSSLVNAVNENKTRIKDIAVNVKDFGAKGDNIADDTVAIQNAINSLGANGGTVCLPPGIYKTTLAITIPNSGIQLIGAGRKATVITNSASSVFVMADGISNLNVQSMEIQCGKAGGAIFSPSGMISLSRFYDLHLWSAANTSYIWFQNGGTMGYIDNMIEHCDLVCAAGATVPPWYQKGGNGAINSNTWKRLRVTGSHAPIEFFHIEETGASQYAYDNTFENITGELCDYGIIRALSVKNFYGLNINNYDSTTYSASPIYIGKSATSPNSDGITLINVARRGGTLAAGVYDIFIENSYNVLIIASQPTPGSANFNLPVGFSTVLGTVLLNEPQYNKIDTPTLVATLSGTTAARPTIGLSNGMCYYDTTLGKPIWRNGAAWKDATGTTV